MRSRVATLLENNTSKKMQLLHLLSPDKSAKSIAGLILKEIAPIKGKSYNQELKIQPYKGNNKIVEAVSNYLVSRSHPAIKAAFIQGSIATNEEIAYSDFDGILLIDEQSLTSNYSIESLIKIIRHTNKMMLQHDALQHHGWNILTCEELNLYPDDHLPLVLLEHGKTIYPNEEFHLYYTLDPKCDYERSLILLCNSIIRKSEKNSLSISFRHFKTFISEVLLLPAVYIQAKTGRPIFKRESFELINSYLNSKDQKIIDQYCQIRKSWSQAEADITKELNYDRCKVLGKHVKYLLSPVPKRLEKYCNEDKRNEISALAKRLLENYNKG